MKAFVIDTNVPVTANGMDEHADIHCVEACIDALVEATKATVLLYDLELIMDEYRRHLCPLGTARPWGCVHEMAVPKTREDQNAAGLCISLPRRRQ